MSGNKGAGKNGSVESSSSSASAPWPLVLKIADPEEFAQRVAVAQLAIKLCKPGCDPKDFLSAAWDLIEGAHAQVLREQTDVEHLKEDDSAGGAAEVFQRKSDRSTASFQQLCDPGRNAGDSETINGTRWKVYKTLQRFEDLFWRYWGDIGEKWASGDKEVGVATVPDPLGNLTRVNMYTQAEREQLAEIARDTARWKARGLSLLDSWEKNGVPAGDFSALAKFRRAYDKRSRNLKKPKSK